MDGWIRVTVEDLSTGEKEAVEIRDTYILVAVGTCWLDGTQVYSNGTHILTVKGSKGRKRTPAVAGEGEGQGHE